jgi:O-acetyl-ADP-ribose deacetylase (regulator of RNase III)
MINEIVEGDILEVAKRKDILALVHGCNCFHQMSGGLALQIARKFPQAEELDRSTTYGEISKLGTFQSLATPNFMIFNAYTQFYPGAVSENHLPFLYTAIREVFERINHQLLDNRIAIPKIGAGIAGGDWKKIKDIIDFSTPVLNITLVNYKDGE